ncbi:MAG: CapA family protein [Christensenellales bacterium]
MRRRRLSFGSILVLLLCLAALLGLAVFLGAVGRDSPAAAMRLDEIMDAVGQAISLPEKRATAALAAAGETQVPASPLTPAPTGARQSSSLSLTLGGVLHFDSDITASQSFLDGGGEILAPLQPWLHADLNMVGIDQVVLSEGERASDAAMPPGALDILASAGADTLVLAGGRSLDGGAAGVKASMLAVQARRLRAIGLGENRLLSLRVNGLSIAWLHASQKVSTTGMKATSQQERDALIFPVDGDELSGQAAQLKSTHDLVIVSLNWQTSSGQAPSAAQRTLAHRLGQAGADLILGLGGEQVQQIEIYQLQTPGGARRDVLIAYSLGSLLSENRSRRELQSGVLLHLSLTCRPGDGGVSFDSLSYTPTYVRRFLEEGKVRFQVLPSAEAPPEDMSKAQRDQMARGLRLIQEAMLGSAARLQR